MNPGWLLAAVVAGIVAGERLDPGPGSALLAGAAAAPCVALAWRRASAAATIAALVLLGAAADVRARHGMIDTPVAEAARLGEPVTAWVTLVSDPEARRFSARAVARLDRRRILLTAPRSVRSPLLVVGVGDRVLVDGRLAVLAQHEQHWRRRHVVARLDVQDVLDVRPPSSPVIRLVEGFRATVLRGGSSIAPPLRALYEGFLVGETRDLPDDLVADFRRSGLSHLLAVSGANVAVVMAALAPGLSMLSLRGRLVAGGTALVVFGSVTRWEPSVLRAVTMAGAALVGATVGRPLAGLRVLTLAVAGLLLADPFLLWSLGFRLSCAACAGILVLAGPLAARLPGPRPLRLAVATTLAAQIGVAPVLVPAFGSMPLVAVPANVVVAPLAAPVTVWGLVAGVVGGVVAGPLPEVGWVLQRPTAVLLGAVATVARVGAKAPSEVGVPGAAILAVVTGVWWFSRRLGPDGVSDDPSGRADP